MTTSKQPGQDEKQSARADESAPPTLIEGEKPAVAWQSSKPPLDKEDTTRSQPLPARAPTLPQSNPPIFKDNDTHTQPSLSALSEDRPVQSLDIRRMWRIEEQFDRHDARIRLLEKELTKTRMLTHFALALLALFALVWLVRG